MTDYSTALCTQTAIQPDQLSLSCTDHPTAAVYIIIIFFIYIVERIQAQIER